jgi:outer membrane receptor protein involved in Fe transport
VHGSFTDGDPVFFADRAYSAVTLNPNSSGELVPSGSGNIPGTRIGLSASALASLVGVDLTPPAQCSAITGIRFGTNGEPLPFCDPEDRFNFAPLNFLLRPRDRTQFSGLAEYEIADGVSFYTEFFYIDNSQGFQQAPAAFSPRTQGAAAGTLIVPNLANNPLLSQETIDFFTANAAMFDPNGDGDYEIVGSTRRADELGARMFDYDRDTLAYTLGLKGEFGGNVSPWSWDAYFQSHDTSQLFISQNVTSTRSLNAGLDVVIDTGSGEPVCRTALFTNCVPINIFGIGSITPEMGQFLTPKRFQSTTLERQVFSASIAGDIFELPGGPIATAFGVEWREDKFKFVPDDITQNDGSREVPPNSGEFDVSEVFAEIRAPLLSDMPALQQLAFEAAFRFSDYSTIGSATTWRAGIDWTINDQFRIRGFFNRAIRAPSLIDLFATQSSGFTNGQDPCDIDNSPSQAQQDLCVQQGIDPAEIDTFQQINIGLTSVGGGNPNLNEEESDTITFGFVYQPSFADGLNITVDYYNIEVTDAIASVTAQFVLDECFRTLNTGGDFCQRISRLSDGQLFEVESNLANVAELKVNGIDLQVMYGFDLPQYLAFGGNDATLDLNWHAGWQFEREITAIPGAPPLDCAGKFGNSCSGTGVPVVMDFKTNLAAIYSSGEFSARLQARVLGGLDIREGQTEFISSVDPETYIDLSASYNFSDRYEIYGGVNNLSDNQPPVMGFRLGGPPNTNTGVYDLIGRRYFIGARATF